MGLLRKWKAMNEHFCSEGQYVLVKPFQSQFAFRLLICSSQLLPSYSVKHLADALSRSLSTQSHAGWGGMEVLFFVMWAFNRTGFSVKGLNQPDLPAVSDVLQHFFFLNATRKAVTFIWWGFDDSHAKSVISRHRSASDLSELRCGLPEMIRKKSPVLFIQKSVSFSPKSIVYFSIPPHRVFQAFLTSLYVTMTNHLQI